MYKLLLAVVVSTFALGSASGFAADATKKKEELTAEQKTEIRDRVERLKAERAKADAAKATTTPAKTDAPKKTSRAAKKPKQVATTTPAAPAKPVVKKAAPKA